MAAKSLVAAGLKNKLAYTLVADKLDTDDLAEAEKEVWSEVGAYYERDPDADRCDPDLILAAIKRRLPNPKHHALFERLVGDLVALDVSSLNVVQDFIAVRQQAVGNKLATALAAGRSTEDTRALVEEYLDWSGRTLDIIMEEAHEKEVVNGAAVSDMVAKRVRKGGLIKVAPTSLNERLDGGLLPGHAVIVMARPEVGKTMFMINAIAGFARQGLRVLYVGNEDPLDDIILRTIGRMSNRTKAEVIDDPNGADKDARAEGYENVVFASLAPGTITEIEALVREWRPQVLLVDQLRNLNVGEDNFVRALEKAAQAVRALGKRYGMLVMSVTQAGDSASGKSILDMGDVDNSNTGIPGACDVLLGIGMSPEDERTGVRVFSLCKNKPGANHDFWPVRVEPNKSKYRSMAE